ncbi:MAG: histidine phosphatase family protein [Ferruginibacter sp.]|nr:histidine phosphatase family protein [Ferruginibacter sp.]
MKTLLVIRHAKSSWDIATTSDFERSLNERGKRDVPVMAQRLLDKKITIDAFVSSPAKRAKKTAELFCNSYNKNKEDIILISTLYHSTPKNFFDVVEKLDENYETVAIFSHNPGITEFVNELVDDVIINNMPTCSIFAIQANATKWKDFSKAKKELLFFDYPGGA